MQSHDSRVCCMERRRRPAFRSPTRAESLRLLLHAFGLLHLRVRILKYPSDIGIQIDGERNKHPEIPSLQSLGVRGEAQFQLFHIMVHRLKLFQLLGRRYRIPDFLKQTSQRSGIIDISLMSLVVMYQPRGLARPLLSQVHPQSEMIPVILIFMIIEGGRRCSYSAKHVHKAVKAAHQLKSILNALIRRPVTYRMFIRRRIDLGFMSLK